MQFTPYVIPSILGIVLSASMGIYAYQNRRASFAKMFAAMCLLAAEWGLAYLLRLTSLDLETKILAAKMEYFGIIGVPLTWTAFSLQFTGRSAWLSRRNVSLALLIPLTTLGMVWTNEIHHLFWSSLDLYEQKGLILLAAPAGWWFWIHAIYTYGILLLGSFFLLRRFWEAQDVYRAQTFLNLLAVLAPWVSNAFVIFRLLPVDLDITSLTFGFSIFLLGLGLFRYRFLELMPVAHRAVFDSIPDAVVVLDPGFRVAELNPTAVNLFGFSLEEVIGQPFRQAFASFPALVNCPSPGVEQRVEINLRLAQGTRWFELYSTPLYEQAKIVSGHLLVLRDNTASKEYERELEYARDQALQGSRFKAQLFANVSQELRSPLGVVMGYVDLTIAGSYGPITDKQGRILLRVRENAAYLNSLVSELLDQAQLESGKLKLSYDTFSPFEELERNCERWRILAQSQGLDFFTEFDPGLPRTVCTDLNRTQQILSNLIGNAIKFTPYGSVIVRVYPVSRSQWGFQVQDSGQGIAPAGLKTIFEPFVQLENQSKSGQRGYGLGLSITRQLVELMGGKIEIESQLGAGSTFTVTLPSDIASVGES